MSLSTGRRLIRNRWTELPLPQDIIRHVNQLAQRNPKGLIFTDCSGQLLMAQDDDDTGETDITNPPASHEPRSEETDDDDDS
eukprot:8167361-Ditylum_brightwellii.AAC.1